MEWMPLQTACRVRRGQQSKRESVNVLGLVSSFNLLLSYLSCLFTNDDLGPQDCNVSCRRAHVRLSSLSGCASDFVGCSCCVCSTSVPRFCHVRNSPETRLHHSPEQSFAIRLILKETTLYQHHDSFDHHFTSLPLRSLLTSSPERPTTLDIDQYVSEAFLIVVIFILTRRPFFSTSPARHKKTSPKQPPAAS
jgi:hypothetical protein